MSEKEKILIADDSAMNRAILTEMLGDGYEILEAENGRQAVSIMQTNVDIDLLLLDIMMPEMDGFDVLAMMNKYHWIDDIPVIMISAENASSYVERAYDLGATDYISRPFDMAIVRRRVINTLMLCGARSAACCLSVCCWPRCWALPCLPARRAAMTRPGAPCV